MNNNDFNDLLKAKKSPADWAAECKRDPALNTAVRNFIKKSGMGAVTKQIVDRSSPGVDRSPEFYRGVAEAVYAHGALALTVMSLSFVAGVRDQMIKDGHPDSTVEPCPSTGESCQKKSCPFYRGDIHPITHVAHVKDAGSDSFNIKDAASIVFAGEVGEA